MGLRVTHVFAKLIKNGLKIEIKWMQVLKR
jgi:hypothetical protein